MSVATLGEAPGAVGAQRRALLQRWSHGAERKEGRVCMCESTEGSKRLLFLIYDFTYNYKSYITLLCWPSSVALQVSPHPSPPCSVPMKLIHMDPSLGSPELWLLVEFGQWEAPARDPENRGEWGWRLLSQLSPWWLHAPQLLSDGPSTKLLLQLYSTSPCPFRCRV